MTSKCYYITTTVPYVNGSPHIGHALEFVQADALARLYKSQGHTVTLQTGTDDNAIKNVQSAREAGVEPKEFVDRNSEKFVELCEALSVSYDCFIRTSDPIHAKGVHEFWKRLNADDLYKKKYCGLYCYGCEDFYKEDDLSDGLCPDHQKKPKLVEEENYFFRLSNYQQSLEELIESDRLLIEPATRKAEVLSFIRQGLTDISVSRHKNRTDGWGVSVPESEDQVIYVWIDALINYLTGQGFGQGECWENIWNGETTKIHCVGKNVWKFHAIYWPALLLSAGLPLPDRIYVHGFLSEEGQRISKTLGFKYDPLALVNQYGSDPVRFYLLQGFSSFSDGDFTLSGLALVNNNFLANGIGNLLSRLWKLREKAGLSTFVPSQTQELICKHSFRFNLQIQELWKRIDKVNAEINDTKPWESLKSGATEKVKLKLQGWISELIEIGRLAEPYIPQASKQIVDLSGKEFEETTVPHLFKRI